MYVWRVTHQSGYIDIRTFDRAMVEYYCRTKKGHEATITPIWRAQA